MNYLMDWGDWSLRKSYGVFINRLLSLVFFRSNTLHLGICLR
jgi:hypothetical protein